MSDPTPDVKSVFGHALERATAAEREAYLDAACAGVPAVRAEVDALLRALDRAGPFLAPQPAATVTAVDYAATRAPDDNTRSVSSTSLNTCSELPAFAKLNGRSPIAKRVPANGSIPVSVEPMVFQYGALKICEVAATSSGLTRSANAPTILIGAGLRPRMPIASTTRSIMPGRSTNHHCGTVSANRTIRSISAPSTRCTVPPTASTCSACSRAAM